MKRIKDFFTLDRSLDLLYGVFILLYGVPALLSMLSGHFEARTLTSVGTAIWVFNTWMAQRSNDKTRRQMYDMRSEFEEFLIEHEHAKLINQSLVEGLKEIDPEVLKKAGITLRKIS